MSQVVDNAQVAYVRLHPLANWEESNEGVILYTPDHQIDLESHNGRTIELLNALANWHGVERTTLQGDLQALIDVKAVVLKERWTDSMSLLHNLSAFMVNKQGPKPTVMQCLPNDDVVHDSDLNHYYYATLSSSNDFQCAGVDLSQETAITKAVVELYERLSCDIALNHELVSSIPANPINVQEILCFAPWQFKQDDFAFSRSTSNKWVELSNPIITDEKISVPLELVCYPNGLPGIKCGSASSSGVAAHPVRSKAILSSAYEIIERDAFMLHWFKNAPRERIIPQGERKERIKKLEAMGFTITVVNLTLELLPCALVIGNRNGDKGSRLALGMGAASTIEEAIDKALDEISYAIRVMKKSTHSDTPSSMRDIKCVSDHMLWYEPPERQEPVLSMASNDSITEKDIIDGPNDIESMDEAIKAAGLSWFVVDLNNRSIPQTGVHVVRSIIPGMIPIGFGYGNEPLGMKRFQSVATPLEHIDRTTAVGYIPHPFP